MADLVRDEVGLRRLDFLSLSDLPGLSVLSSLALLEV